jgi:hypothetical protein
MKVKKLILRILPILILISIFIKIQFFPFGFKKEEHFPNTSIYYYKVDIKIKDKNEFIDYLKANTQEYELGSFMNNKSEVDWEVVLQSTHVYFIGWKKVYSIHYKTLDPECNGYKLYMTYDGYIKDYRSCGK